MSAIDGDVTALRARVVEVAESWVGTPYHHEARIKGVGVDCAQLLIAVYAEAGLVADFSPGSYPMDWASHRDEERFLGWVMSKGGKPTPEALPGDILLFQYGRCFSHAAIVVDSRLMIHSFLGRGVEKVEREEFRLKRFFAFTLFP